MDRHTLIVIIVTAAVTTTVTVVVGSMLNFFRLQIATTLIKHAKTSAGRVVLKLIVRSFFLGLNIWLLLRHINAPGAPTRYDVLWILWDFFGVLVWTMAIGAVFIGIAVERHLAKAKAARSSATSN